MLCCTSSICWDATTVIILTDTCFKENIKKEVLGGNTLQVRDREARYTAVLHAER